jgi:hypothetical protein
MTTKTRSQDNFTSRINVQCYGILYSVILPLEFGAKSNICLYKDILYTITYNGKN